MRLAQLCVTVKLWGVACLATSSLSAENIEAAGAIGIWSAFFKGNECWTAAHPQHSSFALNKSQHADFVCEMGVFCRL